MNFNQLKQLVKAVITEAKKKKDKKDDKKEKKAIPEDYRYSEAFDFSKPLGPAHNLYYQQGRSSLGGFTSGPYQDGLPESLKNESQNLDSNSAWRSVMENIDPSLKVNIWEATYHYYDHLKKGMGIPGKLANTPIKENKKKEGK